MLNEVLDVVDHIPPGVFIDATLGGASHSEGILDKIGRASCRERV